MSVLSFLPNPLFTNSAIKGYKDIDMHQFLDSYSRASVSVESLNSIKEYCYNKNINPAYMLAQIQTSYEGLTTGLPDEATISNIANNINTFFRQDIEEVRLLDDTREPEEYVEVLPKNKATYVVYRMNSTLHNVFMLYTTYNKMF